MSTSGTLALPPIGLGTWPHRGEDATRLVLDGLAAGYRLIDTASVYENEDAVGAAIRTSGLPRDEVVVASKIRGRDHLSGDVRGAVERGLSASGLDQFDLYLIHWPIPAADRYVATYAALLECRDAGLVRHVGVSNFLPHHLDRLIDEVGEPPAVDQVQLDPSLARVGIREAAAARGIRVQSWSPLGRGAVLEEPAVLTIAERLGASAAQVVLAWHRERDLVPVVRSASPERQAENLASLTLQLTDDDLSALDALDRGESATRDVETEENL